MKKKATRPDAEPRLSSGGDVGLHREPAGGSGVHVNAFRIGLVGTLGVLIALLLGGIVSQLSTVLVYIGIALFLALGLDPLVSWLEKRMPRPAAIAAVVLVVLAALAGLLLAVIPVLVEQSSNLIRDFPGFASDFQKNDIVLQIQKLLGDSVDIKQVIKGATDFLGDPKNLVAIGGGLAQVGAGVASGITGLIIVLILTLYFMASLRSMKQTVYRFVPAYQRTGFAKISEDITGAVGRYVVGQVSLALINGVLSLILLSIIQAPMPFLLAFFAFIGSLIPLVGTLSASILNTLICLLVDPSLALITGIYYLIYLQVEAYIISPRIMSRAVAVPGAMVVIAAVAGGTIGGVLGALAAIPVAASVIIIVQKVVWPRQDRKVVAAS
ncbi:MULTISPECIES: AI-2E family transporter [Mycetocola]|uniref:AI-2E family transporter n=1 Tax=Mycetocola TaxID=76634 RepID=UPI0009E02741|nr:MULTISPECIES: AI-2E family transporter [Mycetocola]